MKFNRKILITGGAGFIGSNLIDRLIEDPNNSITCLDNLDSFYNPAIKKRNMASHKKKLNFTFIKGDVRNLSRVIKKLSHRYDVIIHLAAKVGVIPSLRDPIAYAQVNVNGTQNMLEFARKVGCKKFIFASSSSVYGLNSNVPWKEDDQNLLPISPYAATKVSGELLGHVYAHIYNIQFIALRLFTVYGPRQRPDLAIHKFAKLILEDKPIALYGDGRTQRDYTYIDDVVSGIIAALGYSRSQYEIINLGNNRPVELRKLISLLEQALGKKAIVKKLPDQPGDVPVTFADISKGRRLLGYKPETDITDGVQQFVRWFDEEK